jgi:hypothetical protein
MDEISSAVGAAAGAAEAVRALNHHTLAPLSPGTPGWGELADLSAVVAQLHALARRPPQALDQLARALSPESGTRYGVDAPDLDADDLVEEAARALGAAADLARSLDADLGRAHDAISHLYVAAELRVVDAGE